MVDFKTKSGNRYHTELHGREEILCKNGEKMGKLHRVVKLEKGKVPVLDYYRENGELWTFCTTLGDEVEEVYSHDTNYR